MSQWERLKQLPPLYQEQLHELYDSRDASFAFPMDVRHYLSHWIEKQEWERAARDHDLAMVLFQGLLGDLDTQHSRFVQEEMFLMQHNFRRFKQNFQIYQEEPCKLASTIQWFLMKEKEILQTADLADQIQLLHVDQTHMESDTQIERKMAGLRNQVQCLEHTLMCLEEQQDEFDFKYTTHKMEGLVDQAVKNEQVRNLQMLINKVNDCRKTTLSDFGKLLDSSEELVSVLLNKELAEWQRRQQRFCIGAPDNICLDQLEKWFTCVADCLFQVRKFLTKLDELVAKLTYPDDPVKVQKPAMQIRADTLLTDLIKSSFVVEMQPSMPQGKGPLVLRTNIQFSVKTRLLVKFPELNHVMKVNVTMDRKPPDLKGYRRFNVLGTSSKALNMTESQNGGMVADFRHLTLKEQKSGGGGKGVSEISLSVTEELHVINFDTVFQLHGLKVDLKALSLPVVVISNSSQQQNAWASIIWAMMLCQDPTDCLFFANCPVATWAQLREMLSWQFLSATTRGLDAAQLDMIAHKLFGKQQNYDDCRVSWSKFSKENCPNLNFTFWMWFDGILVLVKTYLEDLWKDDFIMGFVTKAKEKTLLKTKQDGTFLLRFSESVKDGGITFSWVEYSTIGEPSVKSVQPFTRSDLSQIPLHEIIRNYQILEDENVPENPLRFLYPNTPKDQAFGKYYTDKTGDDNPYMKYIRTKLVMVSKGSTLEAKSPMSCAMASPMSCAMAGGEGLDSLNDGLCEEAAGLGVDPHVLEEHLAADPDPMLTLTLTLEIPVEDMLSGTLGPPVEDMLSGTLGPLVEDMLSGTLEIPAEDMLSGTLEIPVEDMLSGTLEIPAEDMLSGTLGPPVEDMLSGTLDIPVGDLLAQFLNDPNAFLNTDFPDDDEQVLADAGLHPFTSSPLLSPCGAGATYQ